MVFFRSAQWRSRGTAGAIRTTAHGDCTPITLASTHDIHAVRLAADDKGWAVGAGGLIMHSTDGGKTWQERRYPARGPRELITWNTVAAHGSHVWIAGSPGTVVLHSPDNGESWQGHSTGNHTPLTNSCSSMKHLAGPSATSVLCSTQTTVGKLGNRNGAAVNGAAVLVLASDVNRLPLAALAKLSGDGYRTVVHLFAATGAPDDPTRWWRGERGAKQPGMQ